MSRHMTRELPNKINVLLIGGGGREHALAWRLKKSKRLGALWLSDAKNPALQSLGKVADAPMSADQAFRAQQFCKKHDIGLVVIGPEDPLAEGLADALRSDTCAVFGPNKDGARLEADKAWAKQLMRAASIPTAESRTFTEFESARDYLESRTDAQVIKAAGLAKGKGVIVPDSSEEAFDAIKRIMLDREFGAAGDTVIIEERLKGPEVSVLALVDGRTIYVLEPCQDHKRLLEGGRGPNTGGMGAFCPTTILNDAMMRRIEREILVPTVDALRRDGVDYRGVLYAGLMLTPGGPKVLEFNVRFGDPECQPLMKRFKGDLVEVLWRTATGTLSEATLDWDRRTACCVVLASKGYPQSPETGGLITGIDEAEALGDVTVFYAGVAKGGAGKPVTAGGRVLGVTTLGDDLDAARELANRACEAIHFDGMQWRRDIGAAAVSASPRG